MLTLITFHNKYIHCLCYNVMFQVSPNALTCWNESVMIIVQQSTTVILLQNTGYVKACVLRMYQSQPLRFRELYIFILWERCVCYVYVLHSWSLWKSPTTITQTHTERNEASVDWTKGVHVLYLQLNYRIRKTLEIQDILD